MNVRKKVNVFARSGATKQSHVQEENKYLVVVSAADAWTIPSPDSQQKADKMSCIDLSVSVNYYILIHLNLAYE